MVTGYSVVWLFGGYLVGWGITLLVFYVILKIKKTI